jgi:predicted transposase YdaD
MKFNEYIEYVKETCLEIGEEKGIKIGEEKGIKIGEEKGIAQIQRTVVTNMLLQGKSEKDIQTTLGLTASQVRELIHDIQSNAHA